MKKRIIIITTILLVSIVAISGLIYFINNKFDLIETKKDDVIQTSKKIEDDITTKINEIDDEKEDDKKDEIVPPNEEKQIENKNFSNSQTKQTTTNDQTNSNTNFSNDNYVQKSEQSSNNQEQKEDIATQNKIVEDNSVDTTALNYNIHKGKIDCSDIDSCMNMSLPLQFEYNRLISGAFYLEVMSKSNNVLGYYIEYVFSNNTYSSSEECNSIGKSVKNRLSDRVISYQCDSNTLKINTIY